MSTRVLVTLRPDADAQQVIDALVVLGATEVQPPRPELPNVCVATIDDRRHPPDDWVARARQLPGVAEAELDRLRWTM